MTQPEALFHFGLGKIGLGLVMPFFSAFSSLPLVPMMRRSSKSDYAERLASDGHYRLQHYDSNTFQDIALPPVERYDDERSVGDIVKRRGLPGFLSCSVGAERVAVLFPLIASLLRSNERYYSARPLIFLPFENSSHAARGLDEYLRSIDPSLAGLVVPMDMTIDKICARIDSATSPCTVSVESFQEFFLSSIEWELPANITTRLQACGLESHYLDRSLFEFQKRKKTWLINGLHYCIAISAYEFMLGDATIAEAMADYRVSERANSFVAEVMFALLADAKSSSPSLHPSALQLQTYVGSALERMRQSRMDEAARVLPAIRFLVEELDLMALRKRRVDAPPSFTTFYQKWQERVLDPTRTLLLHHRAYRDRMIYLPELTNSLLRILAETIPYLEEYAVQHLRDRHEGHDPQL
jgi:hypothetical protein